MVACIVEKDYIAVTLVGFWLQFFPTSAGLSWLIFSLFDKGERKVSNKRALNVERCVPNVAFQAIFFALGTTMGVDFVFLMHCVLRRRPFSSALSPVIRAS